MKKIFTILILATIFSCSKRGSSSFTFIGKHNGDKYYSIDLSNSTNKIKQLLILKEAQLTYQINGETIVVNKNTINFPEGKNLAIYNSNVEILFYHFDLAKLKGKRNLNIKDFSNYLKEKR